MNQKGFILISALIAIVVIAGVTGFLVYQTKQETKEIRERTVSLEINSDQSEKSQNTDENLKNQGLSSGGITDCGDYTEEYINDEAHLKQVASCVNQHSVSCTPATYNIGHPVLGLIHIEFLGPQGDRCRVLETAVRPKDQSLANKSMTCMLPREPHFDADGTIRNFSLSVNFDNNQESMENVCSGPLWDALLTPQALMENARPSVRDARREADLNQIKTALQTYMSDNGTFPATLNALMPDYLSSILQDPAESSYQYAACNSGASFTLGARFDEPFSTKLENDVDSATCSAVNCLDPVYCIEK